MQYIKYYSFLFQTIKLYDGLAGQEQQETPLLTTSSFQP